METVSYTHLDVYKRQVLGAIAGELLSHRDPQRATTVGLAAGLGFAIAWIGKLLLSAIMLGLFAYAYYF